MSKTHETHPYHLAHPERVLSPSLLFYLPFIHKNLEFMLKLAGKPSRLRPHMKTHKTLAISRMYVQAGILKHKCATLMEADILAKAGAKEILLAYPLAGPAQDLFVKLALTYRDRKFITIVEDETMIEQLGSAARKRNKGIEVMVDWNVGMDRTGAQQAAKVVQLYEAIERHSWLEPGGLHVYDGQNKSSDLTERATLATEVVAKVQQVRDKLKHESLILPRIVFGGTPTFPLYAELTKTWPEVELSPGTCILHDAGYQKLYPDLPFLPAAAILSRCVSRPTPDRLTFDIGTKAVASDPPAGQRCQILELPEVTHVLHNEEHLVVQLPRTEGTPSKPWKHGEIAYVIPMHICPTVALYSEALIVENKEIVDRWPIDARDRIHEIEA